MSQQLFLTAEKPRKYRIYIAGPYTGGDVAQNVRNALTVGNELLKLGFAPYVPHLSHFWHMLYPHAYEKWLELDFAWIDACHALLRIAGISPGASREVEYADLLKIPVFHTDFLTVPPDLVKYFKNAGKLIT